MKELPEHQPLFSHSARLGTRWRALLVVSFVLVSVASASNRKTPAGTIIRNQAAMEFANLAGDRLSATSNEVVMIVGEVYAIEVLPDGGSGAEPYPDQPGQTYRAVAGRQVALPYLLQNQGNALDSATLQPVFDHLNSDFLPRLPDGSVGFRIYNDLAGNGTVDPGDILAATWQDQNQDGILQPGEISGPGLGREYEPDEFANLLVVFVVPATATAGDMVHIGVNATSVNDPDARDDQGNISRVEIVADTAVMTVVKAADKTNVLAGESIAYTIQAVNQGDISAPAEKAYSVDGGTDNYRGTLLFDVLPTGLDGTVFGLKDGATPPVGSTTQPAATGTVVYSAQVAPDPNSDDPADWAWFTDVSAVPGTVTVVGYILSNGTDHYELEPESSMTLEFTVEVPIEAEPQTLVNTGFVRYNDTGATEDQVRSNEVRVDIEVVPQGGVEIYDLDGDTGGETIPQHPLVLMPDGTADQQTIETAQAGSEVYFVNRVRNTGTVEDTYNLTVAGGLPAGWQLSFLNLDGVSPLLDTGVDGIPDTGPLAPGAYRDVQVRIRIPHGATETDVEIELQAKSVRFAGVEDTTVNIIESVEAPAMRLVNNDEGAISEVPVTRTAAAGSFVDFPLFAINDADPNFGAPDTYNLSVDITTGNNVDMSGWSVVFYRDNNQNGKLDPDELSPVSNTELVRASAQTADFQWLIARVFIPGDASFDADPGDTTSTSPYRLEFRAESTNLPGQLSDTQVDFIMIEPKDRFELRPDRSGTIEPGSTVWYEHVLQNYGERGNRFYLEINPGNDGWTYILYDMNEPPSQLPIENDQYYIDLDEAGGATDQATFRLRIFAPAETPVNTVDVTAVTAIARDHGIALTSSVVDVTRVVAGDLVLIKSVNPPGQVRPGEILEYTTEFFNKSNGPLTNVIIYDQIPAYVRFVADSQSSSLDPSVAYEVSLDGGASWEDAAGKGAGVTNLRVRIDLPLPPGERHTITFEVEVK